MTESGMGDRIPLKSADALDEKVGATRQLSFGGVIK
jgi:hypothetical protein